MKNIIVFIYLTIPIFIYSQGKIIMYGDTNFMELKHGDIADYYTIKKELPDNFYCITFPNNENIEQEYEYKNGVNSGIYIYYHSNGNIREYTTYEFGKKNGVSYTFYDNPNYMVSKAIYINDTLDGLSYEYFEDGNIQNQYSYIMGQQSDTFYFYYSPNKIRALQIFIKDTKYSKMISYYENGQIKDCGYYNNHKAIGKWIHYNIDGVLVKEFDFGDDGILKYISP